MRDPLEAGKVIESHSVAYYQGCVSQGTPASLHIHIPEQIPTSGIHSHGNIVFISEGEI